MTDHRAGEVPADEHVRASGARPQGPEGQEGSLPIGAASMGALVGDAMTGDEHRPERRGERPPPRRPLRARLLDVLVPTLLAALGLAGALVAWRVGMANDTAADATISGLAAARARSAAVMQAGSETARGYEAWLDYERSRQRARALDAAGLRGEAQEQDRIAASNWFLVPSQFLDASGRYDPEQHRAALIEATGREEDIEPAPHFAVAEAEYGRVGRLLIAGVVIAAALLPLTLGEIARSRLRAVSIVLGTAIFAVGAILAALAWA